MVAYPGSVVYHAPSGLENREGGKLAGPRPISMNPYRETQKITQGYHSMFFGSLSSAVSARLTPG
jgi:hypothetical protein